MLLEYLSPGLQRANVESQHVTTDARDRCRLIPDRKAPRSGNRVGSEGDKVVGELSEPRRQLGVLVDNKSGPWTCASHSQPKIALWPADILPKALQLDALLTIQSNIQPDTMSTDVGSGGPDDDIGLEMLAVDTGHAVMGDLADAARVQGDIRPMEGT